MKGGPNESQHLTSRALSSSDSGSISFTGYLLVLTHPSPSFREVPRASLTDSSGQQTGDRRNLSSFCPSTL